MRQLKRLAAIFSVIAIIAALAPSVQKVSAATMTFSSNAHPESDSFDGIVGRDACGGTSWASVRGASSGNFDGCGIVSDSGTDVSAYEFVSGATVSILRVIELLPTSSLPDTAVISSAKVCHYYTAATTGESLGLVNITTTSSTAISTNDFGTMPDTTSAPPAEGMTRVALSGITTGGYTCHDLNATGISWINLTGNTNFGWRFGRDLDNTSGAANYVARWRSADYAGTSSDPYLEVTYTMPGVGGNIPIHIIIMFNPAALPEQVFIV